MYIDTHLYKNNKFVKNLKLNFPKQKLPVNNLQTSNFDHTVSQDIKLFCILKTSIFIVHVTAKALTNKNFVISGMDPNHSLTWSVPADDMLLVCLFVCLFLLFVCLIDRLFELVCLCLYKFMFDVVLYYLLLCYFLCINYFIIYYVILL